MQGSGDAERPANGTSARGAERDAWQTRPLDLGPFGGAGEGTTPFAAQRRAIRSLGCALPPRGSPVAGEPGLVSPSRRLSSARRRSRVCEPRAACEAGHGVRERGGGVSFQGFGVSGLQPRGSAGIRSAAARGPAGNDPRRVPYPRQAPLSPDTAGRVDRPGGPSAPGLSPTWHRFQLGLYLRSREGERHKPRKRCGQARHGQ